VKAVLAVSPGRLTLGELPTPEIAPYEALVRVEACGVCNGTDTKLVDGEFLAGPYPAAIGHESVGRIVDVGGRVRHFGIGDRVLRPLLYDHHVSGGRSTWGGMAEYGIVIDAQAIREDGADLSVHWAAAKQQRVPPSIGPAEAAALVTLKEALHFVQTAGIGPDRAVAIVGTGPAARGFCFFSRRLGARPIIVFGRGEGYASWFLRLGADMYLTGDQSSGLVRDALARGGFDTVIEAVGSPEALTRCIALAGSKGEVLVYGIAPSSRPWDPESLRHPRVRRMGAKEEQVHEAMLAMVAAGAVKPREWVSHVLPVGDYAQAFEWVRTGRASKVVLTL